MMAGEKNKTAERAEEGTKVEVKTGGDAAVTDETEAPAAAEEATETQARADDSAQNETETLEERLATAEAETKQIYDRYLRVSAEFENYKKRSQRDSADFRKYANEALFKELLAVVDNLERALDAAKAHKGDKNAVDGLIQGVEMTLGEILRIFEKFAVSPVEALGELFDPNFHQAVQQEEVEDKPDNTVVQELQKGYVHHDRLLRPSMVVVSKKKTV